MDLFEYIDILNQPYDIFITTSADAPLHWHYYCEILYVMEGALSIEADKKTEVIQGGDMAFIYPLQLHKVRLCNQKTKYAIIKFDIHALHVPQVYASALRKYFGTIFSSFCGFFQKFSKITTYFNFLSSPQHLFNKSITKFLLFCENYSKDN